MPAPKPPITATTESQRDFSLGQIDPSIKRADNNPVVKAGLRQAINWRVLNTRALQHKPGRSIKQIFSSVLTGMRAEEVVLVTGTVFRIVFASGQVQIFDTNGTSLIAVSAPWTASTLNQIVWDRLQLSIYVTYPGMPPLVITWDGVSTWSAQPYAFLITSGGQVRAPFYRLSPKGIRMQPSTRAVGAATLTFTNADGSAANFLNTNYAGTRMRFCGRQILITGVTSASTANATILETLPPSQVLTVSSDPTTLFALGDEVIGLTSNAKGIVCALTATTVTVQLLATATSSVTIASGASQPQDGATDSTTVTTIGFVNETISGVGGTDVVTGVATQNASAVAVWDDEVFNTTLRGWPQSVFVDNDRIGFCDIPALPRAIFWSALGSPTDGYIGATPDAAMLELAPEGVRVQFVVPGAEGSEFVFCDKRIYYIPINQQNPLKPGNVSFNLLVGSGSQPHVRPQLVEQSIVFARGPKSLAAIVTTGAYYRPHEVQPLTDLHSGLFNSPVAIAVQTADDPNFVERYVYVLNSDNSIAVARYTIENGRIVHPVGWLRWSGAATILWIASNGASIIFSSVPPGSTSTTIEYLDATQYLDSAVPVNNMPAALAPPVGGLGPLWWLRNASVTLIDLGTRAMGTYQIDSSGFIIPQNVGGENLKSALLVAGQAWTATAEPFVPGVQPSGSGLSRMFKRRIRRLQVYVAQSTGFVMQRLRSGAQGVNLPATGTVMGTSRVTTWNQDDDPTQPPPLREQSYEWKPTGRDHDPRVAIVKDTPGPLQILEIGMEVTT